MHWECFSLIDTWTASLVVKWPHRSPHLSFSPTQNPRRKVESEGLVRGVSAQMVVRSTSPRCVLIFTCIVPLIPYTLLGIIIRG